jgi:hypothetical protein
MLLNCYPLLLVLLYGDAVNILCLAAVGFVIVLICFVLVSLLLALLVLLLLLLLLFRVCCWVVVGSGIGAESCFDTNKH